MAGTTAPSSSPAAAAASPRSQEKQALEGIRIVFLEIFTTHALVAFCAGSFGWALGQLGTLQVDGWGIPGEARDGGSWTRPLLDPVGRGNEPWRDEALE